MVLGVDVRVAVGPRVLRSEVLGSDVVPTVGGCVDTNVTVLGVLVGTDVGAGLVSEVGVVVVLDVAAGATDDAVAAEKQIVQPARVPEPSVVHRIVVLGETVKSSGPVLPVKSVPSMVTWS